MYCIVFFLLVEICDFVYIVIYIKLREMINIFVMINKSDYYKTLGECRILLKEYKTQERKTWGR